MVRKHLGIAAMAASCLVSAAFAGVSLPTTHYTPTYDIVNNAPNPITDVCMFWKAPPAYYAGLLYQTGVVAPGGGAETKCQDLWKPVYPTGLLLLGLYNDSEGDHLVLFMNSATAAAVSNIDFGTVFPNTDETQLIADIKGVDNGTGDMNSEFNDIFGFVGGDASQIPNGGSTLSAWLTPAASSQPTPGTIEMWSTGAQIGTFTASVQVSGNASTPAPAAVLPFAIGAIAAARRRLRK